jgi:hypothetical protein
LLLVRKTQLRCGCTELFIKLLNTALELFEVAHLVYEQISTEKIAVSSEVGASTV